MANEKQEKRSAPAPTRAPAPAPAPTPAPKQAAESVYSAQELAANHKAFGVPKEIMVVALRLAGKDAFTFPEAKRIVEAFSRKEV